MKRDYEEIKNYFKQHAKDNDKDLKYISMIDEIEHFVDVKKIRGCYPKNLFVDEKELELYLIMDDKMLRCTGAEEERIELTVFRFNDIIDMRFDFAFGFMITHKLELKFKNGETVVLDSQKDTNDGWIHKFEDEIKALIRHLLKEY